MSQKRLGCGQLMHSMHQKPYPTPHQGENDEEQRVSRHGTPQDAPGYEATEEEQRVTLPTRDHPSRTSHRPAALDNYVDSMTQSDHTAQIHLAILTAGHHAENGKPINYQRCLKRKEKSKWILAAEVEYRRPLTDTAPSTAIPYARKPAHRVASYYNPQCSAK
jgi:hypothetical protein